MKNLVQTFAADFFAYRLTCKKSYESISNERPIKWSSI